MLLGKPLAAAWQKKPAMIHVRSAVGGSLEIRLALDRATIGESSFTMRRASRSIRSADFVPNRVGRNGEFLFRRRTTNILRSPGRKNSQNRLREEAPLQRNSTAVINFQRSPLLSLSH